MKLTNLMKTWRQTSNAKMNMKNFKIQENSNQAEKGIKKYFKRRKNGLK